MPTVLIGPSPLRNKPGRFREILQGAGFTPLDVPGAATLTAEELRPVLPEVDAMIAGGELMTAEMLDLAPRLRVIARTGVGYDTVDVSACTSRKIVLAIVPGTNHDSVAEHGFALLLALARRIVLNDPIIRQGGWDRTIVRPLRGQTLGLVGLGRIGRAMATRAVAFGMPVIASDPIADPGFDSQHGIRRFPLEDLLAEADVVSLHLPLTESTRVIFNRRLFERMKPGSFLINTARGGLVNEDDLYDALASGHIAGAGLDVLTLEPPEPGNRLLSLPNVVLSPHLAGIDAKSMADMAEMAAWCVVELHQGRWPEVCIINRELGPNWKWA